MIVYCGPKLKLSNKELLTQELRLYDHISQGIALFALSPLGLVPWILRECLVIILRKQERCCWPFSFTHSPRPLPKKPCTTQEERRKGSVKLRPKEEGIIEMVGCFQFEVGYSCPKPCQSFSASRI